MFNRQQQISACVHNLILQYWSSNGVHGNTICNQCVVVTFFSEGHITTLCTNSQWFFNYSRQYIIFKQNLYLWHFEGTLISVLYNILAKESRGIVLILILSTVGDGWATPLGLMCWSSMIPHLGRFTFVTRPLPVRICMQSVFEVVIDQRICMVSGESFPVDMYAETHFALHVIFALT